MFTVYLNQKASGVQKFFPKMLLLAFEVIVQDVPKKFDGRIKSSSTRYNVHISNLISGQLIYGFVTYELDHLLIEYFHSCTTNFSHILHGRVKQLDRNCPISIDNGKMKYGFICICRIGREGVRNFTLGGRALLWILK